MMFVYCDKTDSINLLKIAIGVVSIKLAGISFPALLRPSHH